ncbi:unnamed protein product [Ectocarpus sp. CCAP 1310/34]|nr:unnamed protein product [Ectocarpus sp. CCAP 1310/34]
MPTTGDPFYVRNAEPASTSLRRLQRGEIPTTACATLRLGTPTRRHHHRLLGVLRSSWQDPSGVAVLGHGNPPRQ